MFANTGLDLLTGAGSFGLSGGLSLIKNVLDVGAKKTEEDKKRSHEITLSVIAREKQQAADEHEDVQRARDMVSDVDKTTLSGSFMGWTRRILAMTVPFLVIALVVIAIISLAKGIPGVSIPTTSEHNILFGLVTWTSHNVEQLQGLVWMPWFQLWFFMIGGFYFGRMASK